uniref:ATP-dependent RNA helicase n=1 Tax=Anopheles atroparvus TaxID=41427 RepID=A0A182IMR1_ANOAO
MEECVSIPSTAKQRYLVIPPKLRLVTLSGLIALEQHKKPSKALVFMATQDLVDFHYDVMVEVLTSKQLDSDDENENDADETNELLLLPRVVFFKLHGGMTQVERSSVFLKFRRAKTAVLLCTDMVARGIDIPIQEQKIDGIFVHLGQRLKCAQKTIARNKEQAAIVLQRRFEQLIAKEKELFLSASKGRRPFDVWRSAIYKLVPTGTLRLKREAYPGVVHGVANRRCHGAPGFQALVWFSVLWLRTLFLPAVAAPFLLPSQPPQTPLPHPQPLPLLPPLPPLTPLQSLLPRSPGPVAIAVAAPS